MQDAYLRFTSTDRAAVRDVKAFLVTIVTRLALDRLKSAQKRREEYIGPWLPEPVLTGIDGDPYARATRDEQIELALLRTLSAAAATAPSREGARGRGEAPLRAATRGAAPADRVVPRFEGERIAEIASIVNPEKLEFARRQSLAHHPPER